MTATAGLEIVPASHGAAWRVHEGEHVTVVDVEGGQAVDLFAFSVEDRSEYLSPGHTRVTWGRLFPAVGQAILSNRRRPMLTIIEDTSPGHHDMLLAACDRARYELLGVDGHRNCADNLAEALAAVGHPFTVVPEPVNLFTYIPVEDDGTITFMPSDSQAGDRVVFRAERDLVVVASSCPQDLTPINHGRPTPIGVEITTGG